MRRPSYDRPEKDDLIELKLEKQMRDAKSITEMTRLQKQYTKLSNGNLYREWNGFLKNGYPKPVNKHGINYLDIQF